MTTAELLLSAQRALLFNITLNVRLIFIEARAEHLIMLVYSDIDLTDEEKDVYYSSAGEITGDFVELDTSEVFFIVTTEAYEKVDKLEHLVFARYEYLMPSQNDNE